MNFNTWNFTQNFTQNSANFPNKVSTQVCVYDNGEMFGIIEIVIEP